MKRIYRGLVELIKKNKLLYRLFITVRENFKQFIFELEWITKYIYLFINKNKKKNCVILIGEPTHGNIGDAAIAFAEYEFIKDKFKKDVFAIPSRHIRHHTKLFKHIIDKEDILYFHGGGFIGSLWPSEVNGFILTMECFPDNVITVLPQTVFFSDDEQGKEIMKKLSNSFSCCKHLTIFVREKYSYDIMKKFFPNVSTVLAPDMVTYLSKSKFRKLNLARTKSGILCCLRSDHEKIDNKSVIHQIITIMNKKYNQSIVDYTDTVMMGKTINKNRRETVITKKIEEFSKYSFVITDRLHGMVFSAIAQTPCIAVACNNYKIKGVYEWISDNKYIHFLEEDDDVEAVINSIMSEKTCYDNTKAYKYFSDIFESKLRV